MSDLIALLEQGRTQPPECRTLWVHMSPELAEYLLTKNAGNRRERLIHVARLARDMAAGNWVLNHQGVAVSTEGKLLDGQHRLHAVVDSGCTVPMLVTVGIPEDARRVIDTGARRSAADFQDGPNAHMRAAAAKLLCAVRDVGDGPLTVNTMNAAYNRVTIAQQHALMDDEEGVGGDLLLLASQARSAARVVSGIGPSPLLAAAAMWPATGDALLDGIATGAGLEAGDPRLALRNYTPPRRGLAVSETAALAIKTAAALAQARPIRLLRINRDERLNA